MKKTAALAILLSLLEVKELSASPSGPEYKCTSSVNIYIDVSGSLSRFEQEQISNEVAELLVSRGGIFSADRSIKVFPFAQKVGPARDIGGETVSEISANLMRALEPPHDGWSRDIGDKSLTNLGRVIEDIRDKTERSSVYTIYVIASDFEHDPYGESPTSGYRLTLTDWETYGKSIELWKEQFKASSGVLLLVDLPSTKNAVGREVVSSLRGLLIDGSQLQTVGPSIRDLELSRLLPFFRPVRVDVSRTSGPAGPLLKINLTNNACVGDLRLGLALDPDGKLKPRLQLPEEATLKNIGDNEELIYSLKDLADKVRPVDDDMMVSLTVIKKAEQQKDDVSLTTIPISFRDYIELSDFSAEPVALGRRIRDSEAPAMAGKAILYGSLLEAEKASLKLLIELDNEIIGMGEIDVNSVDIVDGLPLAEDNLRINMEVWPLLRLCSPKKGEGVTANVRVKVTLQDAGGSGVDSVEDVVRPLKVKRSDVDGGFLEELFAQGSIGGLITLMVAWWLTRNVRHIETGRIEEIMALVAVLATTSLVILHETTVLGSKLDYLLLPWVAAPLGCLNLIVSSLLVMRLHNRGGLRVCQSDADVAVELDVEAAYAAINKQSKIADKQSKVRVNLLRLSFFSVAVLISLWPIWGLLGGDESSLNCRIELVKSPGGD